MSDAGVENAAEKEQERDDTALIEDTALVEARMAAILARFPDRFTHDEVAAIRKKVSEYAGLARKLHGTHLDPSVEPPPFVPNASEGQEP